MVLKSIVVIVAVLKAFEVIFWILLIRKDPSPLRETSVQQKRGGGLNSAEFKSNLLINTASVCVTNCKSSGGNSSDIHSSFNTVNDFNQILTMINNCFSTKDGTLG
jgi:hypothetical protein